MPNNYKAMLAYAILTAVLTLTVLVYLPGLPGPFLFDDAAHVSKNQQVHITELTIDSLVQAWHSSHLSGMGSRPLAQLSFGINHALGGLNTSDYKATNLAIHLLTGLLIFALVRQIEAVMARPSTQSTVIPWTAILVAGLWLLHPINLTPVLYVVQRMTSLSALFVLAGLWCHIRGRRQMAAGSGYGFILALAGLPMALVGVLAKETALLYPLLVLVVEWTLLRQLASPRRGLLLLIVSGLPLLAGAAYFWTHPWFIDFSHRDFTLTERLMSETRILWIYLKMLFIPDLSTLGLFHDDIALSHSLLTPWTTLTAVLSWLILVPLAVVLASRWPIASFGLLFFLAGHAMESTIFPLEPVFEHRNYLPSFGPIFAIGWLLSRADHPVLQRWLALTAMLALSALAALTHLRSQEWSTQEKLILSEVRHHPQSPRANFRIAQLLMDAISKTDDPQATYVAARHHLQIVRETNPKNTDALFGLVFLELFINRYPPHELLDELIQQLRTGVADPTVLSIGQFAYLVRWQESEGRKLPHQRVLAIMQAAADNPLLNAQGRAAVLSATRAYHDRILKDLPAALHYAKLTVQTWPSRWHYHYRLVQLLIRLGQWDEAQAAFDKTAEVPSAALNTQQRTELADALQNRSTEKLRIHD